MAKSPCATSATQRVVRVVVVALATYRAVEMILGEDGPGDVIMKFREWVYETFDESHWVARGFSCPYCLSFWMSCMFMLLPDFMATWFAAAQIACGIVDYDRRNA